MEIKLNKPFATNSAVDSFDVRQIKKALNRLGYYQPYEKTGITDIPDAHVFAALKAFQKDQRLMPTGTARPDDDTVKMLNKEFDKKTSGPYIWRTVGDTKVRKNHAELNGTLRDFTDSPDPGEDFNCRCWAAPADEATGLFQDVISSIDDAKDKWGWTEFVGHFYRGKGKAVSLPETGLLSDVIDHARSTIFERVEKQIEEKARSVGNGNFTDTFARSYDFGSVSFSLGHSTIKGHIKGHVKKLDKVLVIDAQAEYLFFDQFTDPLSIRQGKTGTSYAGKADPYTEAGGTAYDIVGRWLTQISGTVNAAAR